MFLCLVHLPSGTSSCPHVCYPKLAFYNVTTLKYLKHQYPLSFSPSLILPSSSLPLNKHRQLCAYAHHNHSSALAALTLSGPSSTLPFAVWYWSWVASTCSSLKQGFGSRPETEVGLQRWEYRNLATRPAVSDKPLALRLCRKEFPQRWKVVKQVKYLLGGKRVQYVWIDTREDSERESWACGILNHLHGAFLLGFLWPVILICLVQSLYLVYLRILPCVCMHL